jgi:pyruvate-formate lyase-activating enzyme
MGLSGRDISTMNRNILNSESEELEQYNEERCFFSDIGIAITNRCNIECRHCVSDCRLFGKEKLSETSIMDIIKQSARLNSVRSVVFTGGEPFLEYDTLIKSVSLCKTLGLEARVVTNGFWASTPSAAEQKLKELNGLKIMNVSTDPFHQEFIPIDRIRTVIKSCHILGIKCIVHISHLNNPAFEIRAIRRQLIGLEKYYIIHAEPVIPFGRAADLIDPLLFYAYNPTGMPCCAADGPLIEANGDVMFCCGGLSLHPGNSLLKGGNICDKTLNEIKESADINPIIQLLRLRGPSGLVNLVRMQAEKERYQFTLRMEEATNLCSLCKDIVTNSTFARMLRLAVDDPRVYHEIAILRLKEFGEISMLYRGEYEKD